MIFSRLHVSATLMCAIHASAFTHVSNRNVVAPPSVSARRLAERSTNTLPIPSAEILKNVQPELGYDDLYIEPRNDKVPKVGEVMRMLPKEIFEIDTAKGLFYFGLDFAAVALSMGFLNVVVTSDLYHSFPIWGQALAVAPLQVLTGFAMWCMWCIGHDAGHSTISKNKKINRVVGEIAHSVMCLTPFVPWARSHRRHHLNHNHISKDYSHQWFIREEKDDLPLVFTVSYWTRMLQLPILYLVYLLAGVPDGGHVIFYGKLWENAKMKEKMNAAISVVISCVTAGSFWYNMGTADFAVVCFMPWLVMSFWLFMVTYLQHHSDDGKVYTDDTFSFERGAFETVDRNYGKWVNRMSHHMMDGHVIHHLFFEKVPQYNLEKATDALIEGMENRGQSHLYKRIETLDFTQEIIRQFNENWFFIDEKQVVRELK